MSGRKSFIRGIQYKPEKIRIFGTPLTISQVEEAVFRKENWYALLLSILNSKYSANRACSEFGLIKNETRKRGKRNDQKRSFCK